MANELGRGLAELLQEPTKAKLRYIIFDQDDGRPFGTNDRAAAEEFAKDDWFIVVDTATGEWISFDMEGKIFVEEIEDIDG